MTSNVPVSRAEIANAISRLARFKLSHLCTRLEEAHGLRAAIAESLTDGRSLNDVPRILIKRDDTTGLAFGGNKGRHFEFAIGHILAGGYDTVININDYHSNQARFAAAACAKAGLRYILISTDKVDRPLTGNLLLCKLLGAEIHRVPASYSQTIADKFRSELEAAGSKPFILHGDPVTDLMGTFAFVETGLELERQLSDAGVDGPAHMWGLSGRSIVGLKLYARNRGLDWKATAVLYSPGEAASQDEDATRRSVAVSRALGLPLALEPGDVQVLTGYAGPEYGVPFEGVFEAIHLAGRAEGLVLDPNYTGKSMAGLIGEIRASRVDPRTPVVFIHSGGLPQVFAFADELSEWEG